MSILTNPPPLVFDSCFLLSGIIIQVLPIILVVVVVTGFYSCLKTLMGFVGADSAGFIRFLETTTGCAGPSGLVVCAE